MTANGAIEVFRNLLPLSWTCEPYFMGYDIYADGMYCGVSIVLVVPRIVVEPRNDVLRDDVKRGCTPTDQNLVISRQTVRIQVE